MTRHGCLDRCLVVKTIPDEASDDVLHVRSQRRHLRRSLLMALRHRGGDHLPLGLDAEGQFLPALALPLTMFLGMPVALTIDRQATTVANQGYRSLRCAIDLPPDLHRGIAS